MTLDERTLRAAGLPASLISLLVSITKAADRATAAANTAAVASDLEPQVSAALQALRDMEVVPGLASQIDAVTGRLAQIEGAPQPVTSIESEDGYLVIVMADGTRIIGPKLADDPVDPDGATLVLTGGSLAMDGPDLVITPPVASIQAGTDYISIFEDARNG